MIGAEELLSHDETVSDGGDYRYLLRRQIGQGQRKILMVIHCPSVDSSDADPGIARCVEIATGWGYDTLYIGSRYSKICDDPADLWIGLPPNDAGAIDCLIEVAKAIDIAARAEWTTDGDDNYAGVVICWGALPEGSTDDAINGNSINTALLMRKFHAYGIEIDVLGYDPVDGSPLSALAAPGDIPAREPYE